MDDTGRTHGSSGPNSEGAHDAFSELVEQLWQRSAEIDGAPAAELSAPPSSPPQNNES